MSSPQKARFEFGQNWSDFSKNIDETEVEQAVTGLEKLLPENFKAAGKTFLDIGSGSGLHAIAAAKLGFLDITCTDYDKNSVSTTTLNAKKFDAQGSITAFQDDILNSKLKDKYDVVYSWGVLHHTGHMWDAIEIASQRVKKGGTFIIAIYTETKFCGMWKVIKKTYCNAPRFMQKIMGYAYHFIRSFRQILNGQLLKSYKNERGMNRFYDSIDWLGGYPYESATKGEITSFLEKEFTLIKSFRTQAGLGLLGTGCAEYTFIKK